MLFEPTRAIWSHIALVGSNSTRSLCDLLQNSTAQSAINIFQSPYSTPKTFLVTECYMEIQIALQNQSLQNYFRSLYKE